MIIKKLKKKKTLYCQPFVCYVSVCTPGMEIMLRNVGIIPIKEAF